MDRDVEARWRGMEVDTLVLAFEHDVDSPPDRTAAAAELMSRGCFEMLPGVGHLGPFQDMDSVKKAIVDFTRNVDGPAGQNV